MDTRTAHRPATRRPIHRRSDRTLAATVGVSLTFSLLLFTALLGVTALQGVRGYVLGEGLWGKAQKRAVIALHRYADSGNPAEYDEFLTEVGITLSDRRARLELMTDRPDPEVVREGFEGGQVPPTVVDAMYMVSRLGRQVGFVRETLAIWGEGDRLIDELIAAAEELRAGVEAPSADSAAIRAAMTRIDVIDRQLTVLEQDFSTTFNAGAHDLERALRWILVALGLGLVLTALLSYRSATQQSRKHQEQLARSEARYRQLFERNLLGAALMSPDGHVLQVNEAFAEIFGYDTPQEMVGLSTHIFYAHPEERGAVREELEREGRLTTREVQVRRKDGSHFWMLATSVVLPPSEEEGSSQTLTMVLDISERKALEEELARARRLEAMGQIAGGVAHDFNNLLTVIQGNASLALEQAADPNADLDPVLIEEVAASAEAAAALTSQLLDFSRGQAPDVHSVDLNHAVEQMVALLGRLLPPEVSCRTRLAADLPPVRLTRAHVDQVVLNLALNARDAMPDGGELTIRTALAPGPDSDGCQVVLGVSDTGTGMNPEVASRALEPFFTTKKRGRGTGMGLATVYGIVTRASGDIQIDTRAGAGTTVWVTLPAEAEEPEDVSTQPEVEPFANGNGNGHPETTEDPRKLVLLVEDTEPVRLLTRRVLERQGFDVVEAADGAAGLKALERLSGPPLLVISDIVMPGMDGPEMIQHVRARFPHVPVIYMSGYTDRALEPEELEREATTFLSKPFRAEELREAVRQILTGADATSRRN